MTKTNIFKDLNKVIIIQTPDVISDFFGGYSMIWKDFFQTWAHMKQVNNLSPQVRSHNFSHNFFEFTTRKHKQLKTNMRIMFNGRIFEIETINDHPDNPHSYSQIIAYEQVKNDIRSKH